MKNPKKLNAKGFAHWLVPVLAIVIIGAIGSYVYLRSSHAATITQSQCTTTYHGVWKDLTGYGVPHGPCWSTPGAYLINWGAGKVGDGIDQVPLYGNNPETGNNRSQKFDNPNYIIVVSGKWDVCGKSNTCTSSGDPFTRAQSPTHYDYVGGKWVANGRYYYGKYTLCTYDFSWSQVDSGSTLTRFCTDTGIYLKRH